MRNKLKKWLKTVVLFPAMLLLAVDAGGAEQAPESAAPSAGGETTEPTSGESTEAAAATDGEQGSTEVTSEEAKATGAPETYEPFVLPEGIKDELGMLGKFSEIAKAKNLSQADAQELVDFYHKEMFSAQHDKITRQWDALKASWSETAKTDPEIGGVNFEKNLAVAQRAIKTFATPALEETLSQYGMDRHPEMIRMFYWIGQQIKEDDKHIGGGDGGNLSPEQRMAKLYPKSQHQ
jgi:hypothetical protein